MLASGSSPSAVIISNVVLPIPSFETTATTLPADVISTSYTPSLIGRSIGSPIVCVFCNLTVGRSCSALLITNSFEYFTTGAVVAKFPSPVISTFAIYVPAFSGSTPSGSFTYLFPFSS